MRTTSLRNAIFPMTFSLASRSHASSKRESGSINSSPPKSSSPHWCFAFSISRSGAGDVDLIPTHSSAAPSLLSARIGMGARVCSAVVGARMTRTSLLQVVSNSSAKWLQFECPRSIFCRMSTDKATFGAGCFWGVEETFRKLKGVTATEVGYAGGTKENPSYEDVCSDETGHAEVLQLEFDPSQISYDQLLDVFWSNHNPTTMNRQGPDVGTQYRSVIFYHSPEQQAAAAASKERVQKSGRFNRPVVTQIEPAPPFWRAEEYHQRYLQKRGQSHCAV